MAEEIRNLIIIGSGPAGLTAAIYSARAQLNPIVISGHEPGGQLTLTTDVEDFPGFPEGIQGPELVERMREQAGRFGVEFVNDAVTSVDFSSHPFRVSVGERQLAAKSIIVATGASARWLGLPSEQRLIGHGVSSCAVCDGFFFKGKPVVVVGGGDSAMKEALYLSKLASHVTLVHRSNDFRAQKILLARVSANPQITMLRNTVVEEVLGESSVSAVRLHDMQDNTRSELPCQGVFVAIGHVPNTKPFVGQLALDGAGYIVSADGVHTSVAGVFVSGDVHDQKYRQAVTAAGAGCAAAMEAEEYIEQDAADSKT